MDIKKILKHLTDALMPESAESESAARTERFKKTALCPTIDTLTEYATRGAKAVNPEQQKHLTTDCRYCSCILFLVKTKSPYRSR